MSKDLIETSVLPSFFRMLQTEKYSDLVITCPADGKSFKAHKVILCPQSGFFEAECNDLPQNGPQEIQIRGFRARTIERVLQFLYSGSYSMYTEEEMIQDRAATQSADSFEPLHPSSDPDDDLSEDEEYDEDEDSETGSADDVEEDVSPVRKRRSRPIPKPRIVEKIKKRENPPSSPHEDLFREAQTHVDLAEAGRVLDIIRLHQTAELWLSKLITSRLRTVSRERENYSVFLRALRVIVRDQQSSKVVHAVADVLNRRIEDLISAPQYEADMQSLLSSMSGRLSYILLQKCVMKPTSSSAPPAVASAASSAVVPARDAPPEQHPQAPLPALEPAPRPPPAQIPRVPSVNNSTSALAAAAAFASSPQYDHSSPAPLMARPSVHHPPPHQMAHPHPPHPPHPQDHAPTPHQVNAVPRGWNGKQLSNRARSPRRSRSDRHPKDTRSYPGPDGPVLMSDEDHSRSPAYPAPPVQPWPQDDRQRGENNAQNGWWP